MRVRRRRCPEARNAGKAGAIADEATWSAIRDRGIGVADHLSRHDAYALFDAVGGLIRTGKDFAAR